MQSGSAYHPANVYPGLLNPTSVNVQATPLVHVCADIVPVAFESFLLNVIVTWLTSFTVILQLFGSFVLPASSFKCP